MRLRNRRLKPVKALLSPADEVPLASMPVRQISLARMNRSRLEMTVQATRLETKMATLGRPPRRPTFSRTWSVEAELSTMLPTTGIPTPVTPTTLTIPAMDSHLVGTTTVVDLEMAAVPVTADQGTILQPLRHQGLQSR